MAHQMSTPLINDKHHRFPPEIIAMRSGFIAGSFSCTSRSGGHLAEPTQHGSCKTLAYQTNEEARASPETLHYRQATTLRRRQMRDCAGNRTSVPLTLGIRWPVTLEYQYLRFFRANRLT